MRRSIWRSRGCSLAGLDEEGLVWGRIEEFDERVLMGEWFVILSFSGR